MDLMRFLRPLVLAWALGVGFVTYTTPTAAQDIHYAKKVIKKLCAKKFKGRGYVDKGVHKAAKYLVKQYKHLHLQKFGNTYTQSYQFPVNTHPGNIHCLVDGKASISGADYIVTASSPGVSGRFSLLHFNLKDSMDGIKLMSKIRKGFAKEEAPVLHFSAQRHNGFVDSMLTYDHLPGLIIFTEEKKLTHTIARQTDRFSSMTFIDSAICDKSHIDIEFHHAFETAYPNKNIIGYIPGKRSDSLLVFSAHYDHLGMMGKAMFPGASDNASGSSMILYLAKYFSKYKPPFDMVFILFSGEEAGLMGSAYFTAHPTFDISHIKMLINIDIMGDAKNGITVVNGEVFRQPFDKLQAINNSKQYLPEVRIRGKAKNSDHYHFSEKGIPAFFIYSMGGAGFYHDIFDKANTLSLENYEQVAKLLIDFVHEN